MQTVLFLKSALPRQKIFFWPLAFALRASSVVYNKILNISICWDAGKWGWPPKAMKWSRGGDTGEGRYTLKTICSKIIHRISQSASYKIKCFFLKLSSISINVLSSGWNRFIYIVTTQRHRWTASGPASFMVDVLLLPGHIEGRSIIYMSPTQRKYVWQIDKTLKQKKNY